MLPPPFGSAPPAIPGIAQPRRRARARRRCVQRADARAGGHLQPFAARASHLASCQPAIRRAPTAGPAAARRWTLRRHGTELLPLCARSSRARQLLCCADAQPAPGQRCAQCKHWARRPAPLVGAPCSCGYASLSPGPLRLGHCCARSGGTAHGGGVSSARRTGGRARIPSSAHRGRPGCAVQSSERRGRCARATRRVGWPRRREHSLR